MVIPNTTFLLAFIVLLGIVPAHADNGLIFWFFTLACGFIRYIFQELVFQIPDENGTRLPSAERELEPQTGKMPKIVILEKREFR